MKHEYKNIFYIKEKLQYLILIKYMWFKNYLVLALHVLIKYLDILSRNFAKIVQGDFIISQWVLQ